LRTVLIVMRVTPYRRGTSKASARRGWTTARLPPPREWTQPTDFIYFTRSQAKSGLGGGSLYIGCTRQPPQSRLRLARLDAAFGPLAIAPTTRPARVSSGCSNGNACTLAATGRATRHERTCSITSSGSTTRECVVEWPGKIGSFQPYLNRPWKWGGTRHPFRAARLRSPRITGQTTPLWPARPP
jgi:hypothetical protein